MRILITGSKGLIGSALKRALLLLHVDVIGIDKRFEIDHPEYGDILDGERLFSMMDGVDGIVHLAAVSRVIDGEKNPQLCWATNVEGTTNVIKCAQASKSWIVNASSREVYGHQDRFPVKESARLAPVNIYGESKLKAEEIIKTAEKNGLITSIVRFSNVFGSVYDYSDRVVPAFCKAAAQGTEIRIDGKENIFDFTSLEDVVQGLLSLIWVISRSKESLPPIHFTSGIGMSLGDIAKIACDASDYPIQIIEGTPRSFDVSKFWGDTQRAEQLLNWRANISVEAGMKRLITQYKLAQRK